MYVFFVKNFNVEIQINIFFLIIVQNKETVFWMSNPL